MNPNFVIMGLPGSGKTTFLAALWHIVEAGEKDCRLMLDRFEGDLTYLNQIAQAWRTFQEVERTSQTGDKDVVMHLRNRETGNKASAFFPDVAGERFSDQIEARRIRRAFVDNLAESDGIMLFVSADSKQDYLSIVEMNAMMPPEAESPGEDQTPETAPAAEGASEPQTAAAQWEPKLTPGQVRLVQMLGDLCREPIDVRPRRLAIIVSAWDLVVASGMTPGAWIDGNMPLLGQFLRTNGNLFYSRIFGVSAQGIDLKDRAGIERAAKRNPSERILIVDRDQASHDITTPLVWLMNDG